jgi:tRNA 2-(methylsulfanyl)-N6-isopentenyladenosine37 hydroxylase
MPKERLLPLLVDTPSEWAEGPLTSPLQLLNDHAHLERKAASNSLELLTRWPQADPPARWVKVLSGVVRDEVQHLARVSRILDKRGGEMSRAHRSTYASDLHKQMVRMGRGEEELLDRLIVSALIEARSCERFYLLGETTTDAELGKLYRSLWASEHGHYRIFLELAQGVLPTKKVDARWKECLRIEGEIIRNQPSGARIHSWVD